MRKREREWHRRKEQEKQDRVEREQQDQLAEISESITNPDDEPLSDADLMKVQERVNKILTNAGIQL